MTQKNEMPSGFGLTRLIRHRLANTSNLKFILWCVFASFGAYFCMYAFRKPFTTGLYADYQLFGIDYKAVLIIVQVMGYMASKFIGIKVISELRPRQRIGLGVGLIGIAGISLLLFAVIPYPYNFIFLFFNGLPLGMIWGVVFSFLEGRRFTELLCFGLNICIIVASGILKTIYLTVQGLIHVSEFWMPFVMCLIFFPFFLLFIWMLSAIPKPTEEDVLLRAERVPMDKTVRLQVFNKYWLGIACIVIVYGLLTVLRDFRDNFAVEIWNEISPNWSTMVFTNTELITGVVVIIAIALIALIKDNRRALNAGFLLMMFGILLSVGCTLAFSNGLLPHYYWMTGLGMGLFLAYTPVQTVLFERMIATFRLHGNARFFVYICDSVGYMGSVLLLLVKSYLLPDLNWATVLIQFSYIIAVVGTVLILISACFFRKKVISNFQ